MYIYQSATQREKENVIGTRAAMISQRNRLWKTADVEHFRADVSYKTTLMSQSGLLLMLRGNIHLLV